MSPSSRRYKYIPHRMGLPVAKAAGKNANSLIIDKGGSHASTPKGTTFDERRGRYKSTAE